jgi:hypothetical protein
MVGEGDAAALRRASSADGQDGGWRGNVGTRRRKPRHEPVADLAEPCCQAVEVEQRRSGSGKTVEGD